MYVFIRHMNVILICCTMIEVIVVSLLHIVHLNKKMRTHEMALSSTDTNTSTTPY